MGKLIQAGLGFLGGNWLTIAMVAAVLAAGTFVGVKVNGHFAEIAATKTALETATRDKNQAIAARNGMVAQLNTERVQYASSLSEQRSAYERVTALNARAANVLATRITRLEIVDREFQAIEEDQTNAPPSDDAPVAPVLDRTLDFLQRREEGPGAGVGPAAAPPADGSGDAAVRPGSVPVQPGG
jgi:hypothetical protein